MPEAPLLGICRDLILVTQNRPSPFYLLASVLLFYIKMSRNELVRQILRNGSHVSLTEYSLKRGE